jgi:hypothetical protein
MLKGKFAVFHGGHGGKRAKGEVLEENASGFLLNKEG